VNGEDPAWKDEGKRAGRDAGATSDAALKILDLAEMGTTLCCTGN
jgi:hypothetical protein